MKIWGEKWVPQPSTYMIQTLPRVLPVLATVSELIEPTLRWWNLQLLDSVFSSDEVVAIKTIPITYTSQPDTQIWRGTASGIFSVRSAYYLAKERGERYQPRSSSRYEQSEIWRMIRQLELPNAGKNFMWRAYHNLLPT